MFTTSKTDELKLQTLANEIAARHAKARSAAEASLEELRAIGVALRSAKPLIAKGDQAWAEAGIKLPKQLRTKCIKLSDSWDDCKTALSWAEEQGCLVGNECSVDGALALKAKWHRAVRAGQDNAADRPKRRNRSEPNEDLEAKLAQALAEIERLKTDMAQLHWESGEDQQQPIPENEKPLTIKRPSQARAATQSLKTALDICISQEPSQGRVAQTDSPDQKSSLLGRLMTMSVARPFGPISDEGDYSEYPDDELLSNIDGALREYASRTPLVRIAKWKRSDIRFRVEVYSRDNMTASFLLLGKKVPHHLRDALVLPEEKVV